MTLLAITAQAMTNLFNLVVFVSRGMLVHVEVDHILDLGREEFSQR